MKKEKIYIFSGLGADERVFKYVDFGDFEPVFINWILPEKTESISSYAKRIAPLIETEKPILIGISFGGMMAIEVSKLMTVKKVILLASAKNRMELPWMYRFLGKLKIAQLLPFGLIKKTNPLTYFFFGVHEKEHKQILKDIFAQTDLRFLKWAMLQILTWQRRDDSEVMHIHGSKDKVIPLHKRMDAKVIKGGGHLITLSHPKELNEFLQFSQNKIEN